MATKTVKQLESELAEALKSLEAAKADNVKFSEQNDALKKALEQKSGDYDAAVGVNKAHVATIEHLRLQLVGVASSPPSPPLPPASDLPLGITEEMVRAKIAECAGGIKRDAAIRILARQRDREAAHAKA